jgi:hypothetical protein
MAQIRVEMDEQRSKSDSIANQIGLIPFGLIRTNSRQKTPLCQTSNYVRTQAGSVFFSPWIGLNFFMPRFKYFRVFLIFLGFYYKKG